jgi:hypothetical protein
VRFRSLIRVCASRYLLDADHCLNALLLVHSQVKASRPWRRCILMSDTELKKVMEKIEYFQEPQHHGDHYDKI